MLNFSRIILFVLIGALAIGCTASKIQESDLVTLEYHKRDRFPSGILNIKAYDYSTKKELPMASVEVNGVYFTSEFKDGEVSDIIVNLRSNNLYDVFVSYIGMEAHELRNLRVNYRDSIVVSVFLKESMAPIFD